MNINCINKINVERNKILLIQYTLCLRNMMMCKNNTSKYMTNLKLCQRNFWILKKQQQLLTTFTSSNKIWQSLLDNYKLSDPELAVIDNIAMNVMNRQFIMLLERQNFVRSTIHLILSFFLLFILQHFLTPAGRCLHSRWHYLLLLIWGPWVPISDTRYCLVYPNFKDLLEFREI